MGGIFRISKAEFIKIFKKPSVYIMGILLAIVIVASLFLFTPNTSSYLVNLNGTNSSETITDIYGRWNTNLVLADAKEKQDTTLTTAYNLLAFYEAFNNKTINVNDALQQFISERAKLDTVAAEELNAQYNLVKITLDNLINQYTNHTTLTNYDFYTVYQTTTAYTTFFNTEPASLGYLNELLNRTSQDATSFNTYYKTNNYDQKLSSITTNFINATVNSYIDQFEISFNTYSSLITTNPTSTYEIGMETNRLIMLNILTQLSAYMDTITTNTPIIVLAYKADLENYSNMLDSVMETIQNYNQNTTITLFNRYKNLMTALNDMEIVTTLSNYNNFLKIAQLPAQVITDLQTLLNTHVDTIKTEIVADISLFVAQNGTSTTTENKDILNNLFTNYKSINQNATKLVNDVININLLNDYNNFQILNLQNYENYNAYKTQEEITKINYLISTKTFNQDYATAFAYEQASTNQANMFDFMYYALKIASVIIIIFAIIMASNILAYEFDSGTIKLLAIRPFKRYKILFGKLLSVQFFVIVFMLFSTIIAGIGGYVYFPNLTLTPVLLVFNATTAFTLNPILLMLINIITLLIEINFYVVIAISLSVIFRSFAGAMSTSLIVLFVALGLNVGLANQLWYTYLPFKNTNWFMFLGSNITSADTSMLSSLLNNATLSGSNFYIAVASYVLFTAFMLLLANKIFKKRDI